METPDSRPEEKPPPSAASEEPAHPARELSLHLLRMLETRMDAAGIVLQAESQRLLMRLQLQILAAAAGFIAIWGGIVLLAIALPSHLRAPVLGAVVALFVLGALVAWLVRPPHDRRPRARFAELVPGRIENGPGSAGARAVAVPAGAGRTATESAQ